MDLTLAPSFTFPTRSSLLIKAIQHQYTKQVRDLLKKGCDPNEATGPRKIRPLMMACYMKSKFKRMSVFKSLLLHDVNIDLADLDGRDCFMYVCAMSLKEEVQLLLGSRMYGLYSMDGKWNTPLHVCARYDSVDVLNVLLQKMSACHLSINLRNFDNHTPMDVAVRNRNVKCIDSLCRADAQSYYSNSEIIDFCQFAGGPSGSVDCDQLVYGTLLKYRVQGTNGPKNVSGERNTKTICNPEKVGSFASTKQKSLRNRKIPVFKLAAEKPSQELTTKTSPKSVVLDIGEAPKAESIESCSIGLKFENHLGKNLPACGVESGRLYTKLKVSRPKCTFDVPGPQPKSTLEMPEGQPYGTLSKRVPQSKSMLGKVAQPDKREKGKGKEKEKAKGTSAASSSVSPNMKIPTVVEPPRSSRLSDGLKRMTPPRCGLPYSLRIPSTTLYRLDEVDEEEEEDESSSSDA